MNRPWVVRAVALLLVLIGLQAGSFQDPDTGEELYFGTADYTAAVRPEARESDAVPLAGPAPRPPAPVFTVRCEPATRTCAGTATAAPRFHPHPTGPPRA